MPRLVAFGGLALLGDDGPLVGSAARGRNLALLAILARGGDAGIMREKAAAYLWPDSDDERARHSLEQALYTLRQALGPDALVSGGAMIALAADAIECDVVAFSRALDSGAPREAVDLYAGPFLDGFHLSRAREFERWVDGERSALHAAHVSALEALAREAEAAGDAVGAVALWRRLASAEPLSSRIALALMRALTASGDRAGALRAAAVHASLLREELGAAPDPAVVAFEDRLRREGAAGVVGAAGPEDAPEPGRSMARNSDPDSAPGSVPPPARAAEVAPAAPAPGRGGRSRVRLAWAVPVAVAVVLVSGAALLSRRVTGADPVLHRVAVEPFRNETGDPSLDPIGSMAADWLTDGLVRTGLVQVVEDGAGDTAGPDGASAVSGRFYRTGDSIWFQTRITRPDRGTVEQAPGEVGVRAERPSDALEPLRQRVLGALGALYDPRISAWARMSRRPPSFAAYQEFAAGLELHAVPRDLPGAAGRFRRAAELDPDFVLPRLWLDWTWIMAGDFARADSLARALDSQREGMSPVERAWHDRISALLAGDNEGSYRAARRMVELAPRSGTAMSLANAALDTNHPGEAAAALEDVGIERLGLEREHGWFLLTASYHGLGDYRRELETAERAIARDGLGWGYTGPGVPALAALGRLEELERRLRELRPLPPLDDSVPRAAAGLLAAVTELRAHRHAREAGLLADRLLSDGPSAPEGSEAAGRARWARVQTLYELGRWTEAERELGRASGSGRETGGWRRVGMSGLLAARRGDAAAAVRASDALAALDEPYGFGAPTFWRARIAVVLGDGTRAITLLRRAFAEGQSAQAWHVLHVSRDFDPLRSSPEFRELVAPRDSDRRLRLP